MATPESIKKSILETYGARTPKAKAFTGELSRYMPGGDTRSKAYFKPYPFVAERASGYTIHDIDGNAYVDYINNFTSLFCGHAHPNVVKALQDQATKGTCHAAPIEMHLKHSKMLCDRIPCLEEIRYCNSASEGTMYAMRAARAFTKKEKFIVIDGGYNGCHDYVGVNIAPAPAGADGFPIPTLEKGIPQTVMHDILVAAFNDLKNMEKLLMENKGQVAAVLMEPYLQAGGNVVADSGYIEGVRKLCDQYDALLILDETVTLRFHPGGWHTMIGVRADLICFGKIIGGGLPVGAFGGRRDIMEQFNPGKNGYLGHSGTFSGNAMTIAAGLAYLEMITPEAIDHVNGLGDRLRSGLDRLFEARGIPIRGCGFGSMVGFRAKDTTINNSRQYAEGLAPYDETLDYMHLAMLNLGVNYVERGLLVISTPMDETVIDETLRKFAEAADLLKPLFEANMTGK